jgi:hypothetical protein
MQKITESQQKSLSKALEKQSLKQLAETLSIDLKILAKIAESGSNAKVNGIIAIKLNWLASRQSVSL